MNILHINQSDIVGGAAIAAYRLHQGLLDQQVLSRLLVDKRQSGSDLVSTISRKRYVEGLSGRLGYHLGLNSVNLASSFKIPDHRFYIESDILNFHNLHGDYFNYLSIPTLTRYKPAVLTLHDMWSFTGHCAYSFDCDRWKNGCGHCPSLDSCPSTGRDSTRVEWKLKRWSYSRSNLTIVSPSKWLAELASESILGNFYIHHIPNGIDTDIYRPLDPTICRAALGISERKKVILFVAHSMQDARKGSDLLISALQRLPASIKSETLLLTMGEGGDTLSSLLDMPIMSLGYIGGDSLKTIAYAASDISICPTRADNLPLVLQESMACGIPMVSFNVGGVPELVRPGLTGLLAEAGDSIEFSDKIVQMLTDKAMRQRMARVCRDTALEEYSIQLQVKRYAYLYQSILASGGSELTGLSVA
jgi:glycosyltransferase involved in cell wall biosynthesis